jgi:hypothetical protein
VRERLHVTPILLLGAGFSRNWGGWLANEALEYLLGHPAIAEDLGIRALLWRHHDKGGFENSLAQVQADFARDPDGNRDRLAKIQGAVGNMFADMNAGMFQQRFEFQQTRAAAVSAFLARFDAIFTLNQDLLLEHFYFGDAASCPN